MSRYMNSASRTARRYSNAAYSAGRVLNDFSALASGDPVRIGRRLKNRVLGRAIARTGIWRWPR